MNYTTNSFKKQNIPVHTSPTCYAFSRCHNHKKCEYCHDTWRKKNFSKITKHLNEKDLKKFKHKKYITIHSKSLSKNHDLKNIDVDNFMDQFKIKRRNKNFAISKNSHFIITKEISYTKGLGHNPHYNIILFSHTPFDTDNKQLQKLLSVHDIELYEEDIYKSEKDNTYLSSLHALVNYVLKFEVKRSELESQISITYNKRDIFTTEFFNSEKHEELQSYFYKQIKEIKAHYKAKLTEAKRVFSRNTKKTSPKNYLRMLKSFKKKKKKYKSAQAHYIREKHRRFSANFWH